MLLSPEAFVFAPRAVLKLVAPFALAAPPVAVLSLSLPTAVALVPTAVLKLLLPFAFAFFPQAMPFGPAVAPWAPRPGESAQRNWERASGAQAAAKKRPSAAVDANRLARL